MPAKLPAEPQLASVWVGATDRPPADRGLQTLTPWAVPFAGTAPRAFL